MVWHFPVFRTTRWLFLPWRNFLWLYVFQLSHILDRDFFSIYFLLLLESLLDALTADLFCLLSSKGQSTIHWKGNQDTWWTFFKIYRIVVKLLVFFFFFNVPQRIHFILRVCIGGMRLSAIFCNKHFWCAQKNTWSSPCITQNMVHVVSFLGFCWSRKKILLVIAPFVLCRTTETWKYP